MKLLSLLLIFFSCASFASTEIERTYGLYGGLSLSSLSYATAQESSSRKGLILGLDYEFPLSDHISLTPNVAVVQKGEENATGTLRLNYIEIALYPKFRTSKDSTGFYFLMGPYISSIISRSSTVNGTETLLTDQEVRNTEGGILGGAGYEFLISHHWTAYIEGKYALGVARSLESAEATNKAIYVNIGFHYLDREDLETNFDRAEEYVKKRSETAPVEQGEQSIRPGEQDPFSTAKPK